MRYFKLITIERRGGSAFQLKINGGRTLIGTMKLNPAKSRHELEITEADYLKYAKDIAMLCRLPGCSIYVESIREETVAPVSEAVSQGNLPIVFANTQFFTLRKIAKAEGVDITGIKGNEAIAAAINSHRGNLVA